MFFQKTKKPNYPKLYRNYFEFVLILKASQFTFFIKIINFLIYDKGENTSYVYDPASGSKLNSFFQWLTFLKKQGLFNGERSAIATIFLEPVTSSPNIAFILRPSGQMLYWSNNSTATILDVVTSIKNKIKLNGKLAGTGLREIEQGLALNFFGSEGRVEKDMTIIWNANLVSYKVSILEKFVKNTNVLFPGVAAKRTLAEIEEVIEYVFDAKICKVSYFYQKKIIFFYSKELFPPT